MKKLILALVCGSMFYLAPTQAGAADFSGLYVTPKFVYSHTNTDFEAHANAGSAKIGGYSDSLFGGAIAIGYDFKPRFEVPVRLEFEYSILSSFEDSEALSPTINVTGKFDTQVFFINTYYDFHNTSKFTPYIGVGIGMSLVDTKIDANGINIFPSNTETNFAWNIGTGISYAFTDKMSVDLAYRYVQLGDGETKTIAQSFIKADSIDAHQIMLGFRYTF